jgi:hypothetical protein
VSASGLLKELTNESAWALVISWALTDRTRRIKTAVNLRILSMVAPFLSLKY